MRERIESLFHACEAGDLSRVQEILAAGYHDVDGNNRWSSDIDPRGWRRSPLFIAVIHGHLDLAKWLLAQGADPNQPTKYGDTPLNTILAAPKPPFWLEATQLLLAHGADPTTANDEGETPISQAQKVAADWEKVRGLFQR